MSDSKIPNLDQINSEDQPTTAGKSAILESKALFEKQVVDRDNKEHRLKHWLFRIAAIALFAIGMLFVLTLSYHVLVPDSWRYLTDDQVSKLTMTVFSLMVGAVVSRIVRKSLPA